MDESEGILIHNPGQDRKVEEIFVWVAVDPKTQLEGIVGIAVCGFPMQAVTSSRQTANLLGRHIEEIRLKLPYTAFRLLRFTSKEVLREF